jgi:hypothetical protein
MGRSSEEPVVMEASEAERFVLDLLRASGPLTTMQVEVAARKERKQCPDQTVLFLTKMKRKGLINGEVSLEKRGWLWWVP